MLQKALDNFYVHYEINVFADHPSRITQIYSDLHAKIQDKFNKAGAEIISSHNANVRDGNRTTIADAHLPKRYKTPSFRVSLENVLGTSRMPDAGGRKPGANATGAGRE